MASAWLLLLGLLVVPSTALAHERRTIGHGNYDVVVGWDQEPSYVGLKNGASIRISQAGSDPAVPVEGADKTLKVHIRQGATIKEFPLRAVFGQPGYYMADIVPTRAGDYQWVFVGTLNGHPIGETFDTADGKFDVVRAASALEFPVSSPDPAQATADMASAQAAAQGARTLALVGIGVGALGLLVAIGVWLMRPRVAAQRRGGIVSEPVRPRV
jgi:hypothetical protein